MKMHKILTVLVILTIFSLVFTACSKSGSPVETANNYSQELAQDIPNAFRTEDSGRSVIAVYKCVIDPDAKTFTIEPKNRSNEFHFLVSGLRWGTVQIRGFSWYPNFWADIKLLHPFEGSGIEVFDPRIIAILHANPAVSMNYPLSDIHANNSVILDPDGYTKLFDSANPSFLGNGNPFMAYMKDEPNRVWSSIGKTEETIRWQMDLLGFGGQFEFDLVVDVSTNGSFQALPIIDNAPEPVQMTAVTGDGLTSTGGSADINVTLLDWQGHTSIGRVTVEAPDLFTGIVDLAYLEPGPNPDEYIFDGSISNDLLAPMGIYRLLVSASDQESGIALYKEFSVEVQ